MTGSSGGRNQLQLGHRVAPVSRSVAAAPGKGWSSANLHRRAGKQPRCQLVDLLVGDRDTTLGPVEASVNRRVGIAEAVDANAPAQRRVGWRWQARRQRGVNGAPLRAVDLTAAQGAIGMRLIGKVESKETPEAAFLVDPANRELARRRGAVAYMAVRRCAAATDGDAGNRFHDLLSGENRNGAGSGVDDDPGGFGSVARADAGQGQQPQADEHLDRFFSGGTNFLHRAGSYFK